MNRTFDRIDLALARVEGLAQTLEGDPDHHVLRSASELRAAFSAREAIEPAVARIRAGVHQLRQADQEGTRREFQRRARTVDHLEEVMDRELLPELRRVGFNV